MVENREIQHLAYIDSLRGIAILIVIVVHAAQIVFHPGLFATILSKGAYGVQLFFIVSALTLFLSYEQRQPLEIKNVDKFFFIRRFLRIAPAFYLATILYTLAFFFKNHILTGSFGSINWLELLIFCSFLGVIYPSSMYQLPFGGWTVQVEMFFYFFIPFLFKVISSTKKAFWFFILSWLGYIGLGSIFGSDSMYDHSAYLLFPSQIPVFALGILLFHVIRDRTFIITRPLLVSLELVVYLGIALVLAKKFIFLSEPILVSIFFAGLVLLMSKATLPLLQNKITAFYGKISYSLYLWHFIIILFFWYIYRVSSHFWGAPQLIAFIVIYVSTVVIGGGVSWVSYMYLEKPGINLGRRIIKNYKN